MNSYLTAIFCMLEFSTKKGFIPSDTDSHWLLFCEVCDLIGLINIESECRDIACRNYTVDSTSPTHVLFGYCQCFYEFMDTLKLCRSAQWNRILYLLQLRDWQIILK